LHALKERNTFMNLAIAAAVLAAQASTPPTPAAPTSGYVTTETGRLFYETAGEGPNVVLIHDGLVHGETWDDQLPPAVRPPTSG
jgi:hypothetical protein